ncbi:DNA polymerase subunit alpha B [Verticillium alfalfae VaMs.102]|uniref:DNA polymerase alpha subunit B n=1 Tax=Verticillium alfalfae (strain VaMs.102 / ATCC MYA-4576 / FGSC 10136) TaxID=526221 RepID=C9SRI7_VERA1|nr:DNA polymerase subunit alpha B [Verticillium alfalfae VaMs.102]EEY21402.1 DNA polymerase subunit alpha B [Verticillium alfalfae VaMs.102]
MADAELQERFGSGHDSIEPDVINEMQSIMRLYELSAEDLYYKWGVLLHQDGDGCGDSLRSRLCETSSRIFRMPWRKNTRQQTQVKTEKRAGATPRAARAGGDVYGMLDGLLPNTPASARNKSASTKKKPYETPSMSRVKGVPASSPDYKSSPMKMEDHVNSMLPIDDFMELIQNHHQLDASEFGSAANQSTSPVIAVGRIASDSPEGKLNAASIVLETSRRTGGGQRVPLNMGQRGFSFFPGQIVAVKGINSSGSEFLVEDVLDMPLLPNAASLPATLAAHRERLRGDPDAMDSDSDPAPLNVLFASGPYTADDNLDFEPLQALCSRAADTYADAVILTGPFIDAEHPLIAMGDFDLPEDAVIDPDTATMTTVFKYLFTPALNRLAAANPAVTILLVPSVRDIIDKHVSWPQDTFAKKDLGLHKAIRIISNPMTLSVNETVMGLSSQDALWELRHEEVVVGKPKDTVLLSRLCRYLLEQRHYFPLFPPADRSKLPKTGTEEGLPPGAMLDVSYLKLGEMVNVRPDLLLVPSFLPPFAKVVESVLVINPGVLSKRRGAGTYARMTLYPPSGRGDGETMVSHQVFDRARVEITKI